MLVRALLLLISAVACGNSAHIARADAAWESLGCDVGVEVTPPETPGSLPVLTLCQTQCQSQLDQTWFVGSVYRHEEWLASEYGLMVEVTYDKDNTMSCHLIPTQPKSDLLSKFTSCTTENIATESPSGTETSSGTESPSGTETSSGTESPSGTETSSGTESPSGTETSSGTESPSGTEASSGTESPSGTEASSGTESPSGTEASSGTESPSGTEASSGTESPSGTETSSGTESPSGTEASSGTESPSGTETSSETESPSGTETSSGTESPPGTETPAASSSTEGSSDTASPGNENSPDSGLPTAGPETSTTLHGSSSTDASSSTKVNCVQETAPSPMLVCPEGWNLYDRSCYHVSTEKGSWDEGQQYCRSVNSTYAKISDHDENTFVVSLLTDTTWIGLEDQDKEGIYFWDGDSIPKSSDSYADWGDGEPNNFRNEDCVEINAFIGYFWNDKKCSTERMFACKREADVVYV
ncbi:protein rtoA-like [Penaeus monodon]|uniref:protein rtoA-like n=1 Tax=Penaeus monodon TaxID=6687 RepID=UPI0018A6F4E5|nr:protein rtoA-like [Penaeus monodon]